MNSNPVKKNAHPRRLFPLLLGAFLALAAPGCRTAAAAETLRILHTNDLHSHLESFRNAAGETVGGFARLATLVARERAAQPDVLLLDAGDIFQGSPYYNFFRGEAELASIAPLHYDARVLGNHELDDGPANVLAQMSAHAPDVPFLCSNILVPRALLKRAITEPGDPAPIGEMSRVLRAGNLRVGVIGITTETLPTIVTRKSLDHVTIKSAVEILRDQVPLLRTKSDLIVVLSHCGVEADTLLALSVPGIDIIVGGHSHTSLEQPILVKNAMNRNGIGGTLVVQAGQWGEHLGELDLDLTLAAGGLGGIRRETTRITHWEGRLLKVTGDIPEDPDVKRIVDTYRMKEGPLIAEKLTTTSIALANDSTMYAETPIGNLVTDIMRTAAGVDFAVQNGGGFRGTIPAGPITVGDIFTLLPFDNTLVTMSLDGRHVEDLLNESLAKVGGGGFLQVSGISFVGTEGRAHDIRINGAPLDPDRIYRVVSNNFTAAGGDGFGAFRSARNVEDTGWRLRDVVIQTLRGQPQVDPRVEGRIRVES